MVGTVLDLNELLGPATNNLGVSVAKYWVQWEMYRNTWMAQKQELRNYLFATDTTTTSNKRLPWKNSTTTPKLTQIRDNLHANYMSALFPNDEWLEWEGSSLNDATKDKATAITAYMKTKFRQDRAEQVVSQWLMDYIDYGNCFGTVKWVNESKINYDGTKKPQSTERGYVGPRFVRIAPQDIVFNPTAPDFRSSPKIVRTLTTLGELKRLAQNMPKGSIPRKSLEAALSHSINIRRQVMALSQADTFKSEGYIIDGFSSIRLYYQSDYVELLTFYGDIYNPDTEAFLENQVITVMDRAYLVDQRDSPSDSRYPPIFHSGWRRRPDNLYCMGPLDNLVGMQYRIDHLENLKADVFDLVAYPVLKIKGYVDDFEYEPGARIYVGDDGDAQFMHPDATALQADNQIEILERRMEELAGAPKEAMGFRTPGEKTKFEMQLLDNAASRVFLNKIQQFEQGFFEDIMNLGLELSIQNLSGEDVVKTIDNELNSVVFTSITKDDILANGVLHPVGALKFAQKANTLQTLVAIGNSHFAQDPSINVHWSGKAIAKMMEDLGGLKPYSLYNENARVLEQAETAKLMSTAQEQAQVHSITPPGIVPGDPASPQGQMDASRGPIRPNLPTLPPSVPGKQ